MTDTLHIVCPQCLAVNRLPQERLEQAVRCGRCRQPLFTGKPVAVDADGFHRHVDRNDIPVVVDFWASWCAPCRMFAPDFEKAAAALEPHYRLLKLDTEKQPALAARLGIRSIPTLAVFRHGQELGRQAGVMDLRRFMQWVRETA
ncbi:MAG: thioredoxin TrxC [Ectothiorhodospiraceae bacterium]|nr:thioredoxin TrxC [Ectothiorhodospiraceae bacterium]